MRRVRSVALALLAMMSAGATAGAQTRVQVEGPRRARATRIVRGAFARPHDLMVTDSTRRLLLPRGTDVPRSVIIVGGDASVGARVRGDVVVVGGDLFLSPGAFIDGQAVAVGGAVYGSTLAVVRGARENVRDETFDVAGTGDALRLEYRYTGGRDPGVELPLLEGLRIPTYDRVDGASVAWGPILRPTARIEVDPTITYRSHIGEWVPGVNTVMRLDARHSVALDVRRGTFTNDAWIYADIINSLTTLTGGRDVRNYYRADRGAVELRRVDDYPAAGLELERVAGISSERAWSVGARDTLGGRPWSIGGRSDPDKVLRANPAVSRGRISSAFVGADARYQVGDLRASATTRIEIPWESPGDERFVQLTFDGTIRFPTFGLQRFRSDLHVVATVGDAAPPQRFAYLGGSGTLPVLEQLLAFGGDELLHLDSRYEIPLPRLTLPFVGAPTVSIRHRIGSAGVQELPRFVQNVGPLVTVSFLRAEYTVDPATGDSRFKAGLSFVR